MLPTQSFMRNAPRVIELNTRLQWEVLVNASDAITYAYNQLLSTLNMISELVDYSDAEPLRTIVSSYCWTIVDQSHAIFQILNKVDRVPNGELDTLLKLFRPVISKMRNGMDHIHENIGNISKKKSPGYGIYGNIVFTTPLQVDLTYRFINFGLGGMQFDAQIGCSMDTQAVPIVGKISNISLAAFDETINLSNLYEHLFATLQRFDEHIAIHFKPAIAELCEEKGLDFDNIMKESITGTVYTSITIQISAN